MFTLKCNYTPVAKRDLCCYAEVYLFNFIIDRCCLRERLSESLFIYLGGDVGCTNLFICLFIY